MSKIVYLPLLSYNSQNYPMVIQSLYYLFHRYIDFDFLDNFTNWGPIPGAASVINQG